MGEPFFWPESSSPGYSPSKKGGRAKTKTCLTCNLYKKCNSPKMEASGKGEKGILVIAEAPGAEEDRQGVQLVGKVGRDFEQRLANNGIDLHRDCRKINAINCRPPKNRTPKPDEIEACRWKVWKEIKDFKPKVILLLGTAAVHSFLGHRKPKNLGGITKWRGWQIPDRTVNAWVCPMFHPSFLNYSKDVAAVLFDRDLKMALKMVKKKFPKSKDEEQYVQTTKDPGTVDTYLRSILHKGTSPISFDYETTGIKPHAEGHKIVTCAISEGPKHAFAFPVMKQNKRMLRKVLKNKKIKKIAQNLKFEHTWSDVRLNAGVRGWLWDTMLASHILDNRRGITGLKFQVYVNFGLLGYDDKIAMFMEDEENKEKNHNTFNRILEANIDDVLLYNGLDALLTYKLWRKQRKKIV